MGVEPVRVTNVAWPGTPIPRWWRSAGIAVTATLLVVGAVLVVAGFATHGWSDIVGFDHAIYMDGAQRWLHGDGFYLDLLYPPTALWLFVPASFLPAFLWWAIPIGFVAWSVADWRPAWWSWPLLALCLAWPNTTVAFVTGYPGLWVAMAIAAGLRWGWPGALVLLKPSLLPFALVGIRTRGWWMMTALLVLATLPMLAMLPTWLQVVTDGSGGLLYSLREVPLMLLPVVAWAGRRRAIPVDQSPA